MASQRLFISTGEVSGDLHGSFLIQALRERRPELEIEALGGQRMAALGVPMLGDTMTLSSIGVVEAIPYILPTLRIQNRLKSFFDCYRPDLVVLIDYIGANVRVGRLARKLGIPVVYYIAPQEWVWSTFRGDTARIVTFSDLILAIFPEEARYYERHGGNVRWIGHPLIDIAQARTSRAAFRELMQTPEASPAVVLAPASRSQELQHLMPLLFETARAIEHTLPAVRFWISASTPRFREAIEQAAAASGIAFQFVPEGRNYDALAAADLLLTKSGTVNLEAALLDLPQVVAYRVDPRTIWVARNLMGFKIPFMCPVNLVDMSPIVPEFLQEKATVEALTAASLELLTNPQAAARMRSEYARIRALLGDAGVVDRAADAILEMLDKRG